MKEVDSRQLTADSEEERAGFAYSLFFLSNGFSLPSISNN
jgi:hypothetical protein